MIFQVHNVEVHCVPAGYVSPYNGFCDENTSADELVKTVRDSDGLIVLPTFRITMLQNYVHKVDNETIAWAQMPFVTPAWAIWSDTWGLCAYFKDDFGMVAMNGSNAITNQTDMDIWSSMVSGTPSDMFRIIYVDSVTTNGLAQNNCPGCIGVTDADQKIAFVESNFLEKLVMHEWGHTNDCRIYCAGTYSWAGSGNTHYFPNIAI